MALKHDFGKNAEKEAAVYLLNKGYKILTTNWFYQKREIDLVAQKDNKLIIIEVKARSTDYFGRPEEFVTPTKKKLLIEAADAYLVKSNLDLEARFDIISLLYKNKKFEILHIKDAFRAL